MLDVLELEKKWSKYHFKKVMPLYVTSLFLVIALSVAVYLYVMTPGAVLALVKEEKVQVKSPVVVAEVNKSIEIAPVVEIEKIDVADEINLLIPSFAFLNELEVQAINYNNAQLLASVAKAESTKKDVIKKAAKSKKQAAKPKKKIVKPKTVKKAPKKAQKVLTPAPVEAAKAVVSVNTVIIGDNSTVSDQQEPQQPLVQVSDTSTSIDELRSVIRRFNNNKNPALSLFIANKYYELGDYKESYNYARETYNLNPDIEDGVLLYAQNLVKLGQTDTAISKLKPYIKKSGSIKAKILLNEIQKGNFK